MKPLAVFCLVLIVAIVGVLWWQGRLSSGPTDAEALIMCTRYASEWYRLPSTARHSRYGDARITKSGETFTVAGWSETPVQRYRWTCQTRPVGRDRWELLSIS